MHGESRCFNFAVGQEGCLTAEARKTDLSETQIAPQVLTQEARYSFTHAIAPEDFRGGRRLSVTFRQSPLRR